MATTNTPTKNSDRPMSFEASEMEPTSTSLINPTSTAATPSEIRERFMDQLVWPSSCSASS
jgi:hypothetical protein